MSTEFQHDCPHCSTRLAGFRMLGQWPSPLGSAYANLVAVCRVCSGGLLILSHDLASLNHPDLGTHAIDYSGARFRIIETWPTTTRVSIDHVPANIASFYEQANDSLRARRWDAAGAMFRKTLDVATKLVEPEFRSLSLFKRIEKLVGNNVLTPAMGQWAHEIRLDGNDAVHDDEPEEEIDVLASQKFTEAFLTYVFTLPKMVELNRAKRDLTPAA